MTLNLLDSWILGDLEARSRNLPPNLARLHPFGYIFDDHLCIININKTDNAMTKEQIQQTLDRLNKGFIDVDNEAWLAECHEDVRWTMVGQPTLEGKQAIREFMGIVGGGPAPEFTFGHTVIGEDSAAVESEMRMPNEQGVPSHYASCDVYRFRGDKISEMTSYIVELKEEEAPAQ